METAKLCKENGLVLLKLAASMTHRMQPYEVSLAFKNEEREPDDGQRQQLGPAEKSMPTCTRFPTRRLPSRTLFRGQAHLTVGEQSKVVEALVQAWQAVEAAL